MSDINYRDEYYDDDDDDLYNDDNNKKYHKKSDCSKSLDNIFVRREGESIQDAFNRVKKYIFPNLDLDNPDIQDLIKKCEHIKNILECILLEYKINPNSEIISILISNILYYVLINCKDIISSKIVLQKDDVKYINAYEKLLDDIVYIKIKPTDYDSNKSKGSPYNYLIGFLQGVLLNKLKEELKESNIKLSTDIVYINEEGEVSPRYEVKETETPETQITSKLYKEETNVGEIIMKELLNTECDNAFEHTIYSIGLEQFKRYIENKKDKDKEAKIKTLRTIYHHFAGLMKKGVYVSKRETINLFIDKCIKNK